MTILIVSEMSVPYAVGGGEVRYGLLALVFFGKLSSEVGRARHRVRVREALVLRRAKEAILQHAQLD